MSRKRYFPLMLFHSKSVDIRIVLFRGGEQTYPPFYFLAVHDIGYRYHCAWLFGQNWLVIRSHIRRLSAG